jgi:hypothetical protein
MHRAVRNFEIVAVKSEVMGLIAVREGALGTPLPFSSQGMV